MNEVELPDGTVIEFPDGLNTDVMMNIIRLHSAPGGTLEPIMREYQPDTQGLIDQTPVGKALGYLTPENVSMAGLEVAPVSGEVLSFKRLLDAVINPPSAADYISNGEFDSRGYGEAMQSHGGTIGMEALGTAPLLGMAASIPYMMTKNARKGFNAGKFGQGGAIGYHGSPHQFDQFDRSKIGTGEGAQAYGHGLYFAESPEVAGQYADRLGDINYKIDGGDFAARYEAIPDNPGGMRLDAQSKAVHLVGEHGINEARSQAVTHLKGDYLNDTLSEIDKISSREVKKTSGHFYKVDIPDEKIDQMLDWDAPLSEQPESVLKVINEDPRLNKMIAAQEKYRAEYLTPKLTDKYNPLAVDDFNRMKEPTGQDLYEMAQGMDVDSFGFTKGGITSQAAGSEYLKSRGIPGIKYFDGNSRGSGQGTRNFVVFDDKDPKILERNGETISETASRLLGGPPESLPIEEKDFYKKYPYRHMDIRGKKEGLTKENAESILNKGFKSSYANTLPNTGPKKGSMNIIEQGYMPKKGDTIYLLPQEAVKNGKIVDGWKPNKNEIIEVTEDNQDLYKRFLDRDNEVIGGNAQSADIQKKWYRGGQAGKKDGVTFFTDNKDTAVNWAGKEGQVFDASLSPRNTYDFDADPLNLQDKYEMAAPGEVGWSMDAPLKELKKEGYDSYKWTEWAGDDPERNIAVFDSSNINIIPAQSTKK